MRCAFRPEITWKRGITANTALRLGRYFSVAPQFWINLQSHYDLEIEKDRLTNLLEREVRIYQMAA